jgi:hypothetical protein
VIPLDIPRGGAGGAIQEYDFGPVLSRDRTLRHEFTFTNSTERSIRLREATATTACCSQLAALPKEPVSPGSQRQISTLLTVRAGDSGKKRVGFVVQTDSEELTTLRYALRATVYPEWEIRPSPVPLQTLRVGDTGRIVIQVLSRGVAGEGGTLPTLLEAEPPAYARFLDKPHLETEADGIISTVRDVEIAQPASSKPGPIQSRIRFRWHDGQTGEHSVLWEVTLPVRAVPSKLVFRRTEHDVAQPVVLRSDGRPFRITGVDPQPFVIGSECSQDASSTQTVTFRIDPERAGRHKDARITIHTHYPGQPEVHLSIFVLPPGV